MRVSDIYAAVMDELLLEELMKERFYPAAFSSVKNRPGEAAEA